MREIRSAPYKGTTQTGFLMMKIDFFQVQKNPGIEKLLHTRETRGVFGMR